MSVGLSAYSVALYSIQRYSATVKLFNVRVSSPPAWCGAVAALFGVWIVAALFAVPLSSLTVPVYRSVNFNTCKLLSTCGYF